MPNPIDWPYLVYRMRDDLGITQNGLGELLMVTAQTVSNWESGRSRPDILTGSALVLMFRSYRNLSTPLGNATTELQKFCGRLREELLDRSPDADQDENVERGAALMRILAKDANISVEIPRKSPKGKTPSVR